MMADKSNARNESFTAKVMPPAIVGGLIASGGVWMLAGLAHASIIFGVQFAVIGIICGSIDYYRDNVLGKQPPQE